jgi:predicted GNAT family N-acyltransferase
MLFTFQRAKDLSSLTDTLLLAQWFKVHFYYLFGFWESNQKFDASYVYHDPALTTFQPCRPEEVCQGQQQDRHRR